MAQRWVFSIYWTNNKCTRSWKRHCNGWCIFIEYNGHKRYAQIRDGQQLLIAAPQLQVGESWHPSWVLDWLGKRVPASDLHLLFDWRDRHAGTVEKLPHQVHALICYVASFQKRIWRAGQNQKPHCCHEQGQLGAVGWGARASSCLARFRYSVYLERSKLGRWVCGTGRQKLSIKLLRLRLAP